MKIFIPNYDENAIGGGWSFLRNLVKGLKSKCHLVNSIEECDIYFIAGCTLVQRDDIKKAKNLNKCIVLRVDNIPEDYRNRGTALSRLKDFSQMADVVIYQSKWAKKYVSSFTGIDGAVILNGVNKKIFNDKNRNIKSNKILYVRSSTNENKRWQEAKYYFREMWLQNKDLELYVVGNFSDYIKLYGEDFINRYKLGCFDEPVFYLGQVKEAEKMAEIYKDCDTVLVPFYNDACSNVLIEALSCGCKINYCLSGRSGGNSQIYLEFKLMGEQYFDMNRMVDEYIKLFELSLQ